MVKISRAALALVAVAAVVGSATAAADTDSAAARKTDKKNLRPNRKLAKGKEIDDNLRNLKKEKDETPEPTVSPSSTPSAAPTDAPSDAPTDEPSAAPTDAPSDAPTDEPSAAPTDAPSDAPSESPTESPTKAKKAKAESGDTSAPTASPSSTPSVAPTDAPSDSPSGAPSDAPSPDPTFPANAVQVTLIAPEAGSTDTTGNVTNETEVVTNGPILGSFEQNACFTDITTFMNTTTVTTDDAVAIMGVCQTLSGGEIVSCQDINDAIPELTCGCVETCAGGTCSPFSDGNHCLLNTDTCCCQVEGSDACVEPLAYVSYSN